MRKLSLTVLSLFLTVLLFGDGGSEIPTRKSRFVAEPDNVQADASKGLKALIPSDAKSKKLMIMDIETLKTGEISYMMAVKGVKDPASDYSQVKGSFTVVDSSMGEMMINMQLDGALQSKRDDLVRLMKSQKTAGAGSLWSPRKFFEAEAVKNKKFPGSNVWTQKWETNDDKPKQTWYDCFYAIKGKNMMLAVTVFAVPNTDTADQLVQELAANLEKLK